MKEVNFCMNQYEIKRRELNYHNVWSVLEYVRMIIKAEDDSITFITSPSKETEEVYFEVWSEGEKKNLIVIQNIIDFQWILISDKGERGQYRIDSREQMEMVIRTLTGINKINLKKVGRVRIIRHTIIAKNEKNEEIFFTCSFFENMYKRGERQAKGIVASIVAEEATYNHILKFYKEIGFREIEKNKYEFILESISE